MLPKDTDRPEDGGSSASGEGIAENYVVTELEKTRKSLRFTRIISIITVIGTFLYLGYITSTIRQSLEPVAAAEIADGLISSKVDEQAQAMADQTRQKVPQLIAQLPDYAIAQMPQYRQALETQIEADMQSHFESAAKEMDGHIDDFLGTNKAAIGDFLKTGQDKAATRNLGLALEAEFTKYLKETPVGPGNETAQQKLDQALVALQQIDKKMARLAANKGLTPQEKKLRRVIAVMSGNITKQVDQSGIKIAKVSS